MTYYLSVDIGASSGRHILSHIENGKIVMEEIYRFPNGLKKVNGHLTWDTESLFDSILAGMKKAKELGKIPSYMGIDTWGVDYVLTDKDGGKIGLSYGYRDSRTDGFDEILYKDIPKSVLYEKTGIQKQIFNTVYQLKAHITSNPEDFEKADKLLMIPDYFGYLLTGKAEQEYTNASTTGLLNLKTKTWDGEILKTLGVPSRLFTELKMPGTTLGTLKKEIADKVGYDLTVMHVASHDTASAVLAVPTSSDTIAYLSSGTWSLLGVETKDPISTKEAEIFNITNEGGYDYRYRCLKNITGLWMIQSIKKECDGKYTFDELCDMAMANDKTPCRVDVNDSRFLAPENMTNAVREAMGKPNASLGEVLACVYHSLADCYAKTIEGLEKLFSRKISALHIIGGGTKDSYLNELAAKACKIPVYAGPTEATAIGNLLAMLLGTGVFDGIVSARKAVFESFDVKKV